MFWTPLYICKSIEYIHQRLLGRPTYGRKEINKYFDISYKKGYYGFIDALIESREYSEVFGENIIPYERYITPASLLSRTQKTYNYNQVFFKQYINKTTQFLAPISSTDMLSPAAINKKIKQGVTTQRSQRVIFKLTNNSNVNSKKQILKAAYRQIFERDINTFTISTEFYALQEAFINDQMSVKDVIQFLACSNLYAKEFYNPYPNTKVIELGTKHILGRAPNNQAEIRYYNQILASKGIKDFVLCLINSDEYQSIFGNNVVPYRRFPTLPAANFPNTENLYNKLTKQNEKIVVPSFPPF